MPRRKRRAPAPGDNPFADASAPPVEEWFPQMPHAPTIAIVPPREPIRPEEFLIRGQGRLPSPALAESTDRDDRGGNSDRRPAVGLHQDNSPPHANIDH